MKLLRAATVLTSPTADPIGGGEVLVDGDTIAAVGPRGGVEVGDDVAIVDLPHHTLMAGLIDCHVHTGFTRDRDPITGHRAEPPARLALRMAENARKLVSAGVTTARDLGGRDFVDIALRDAIAEGLTVGPNLLVATRPITPGNGHCWYLGGAADSPDRIREVTRENLRAGADCLKIMASGGQLTPTAAAMWLPQFSADDMRIVVSEAHACGKTVAAHAHSPEAIRRCLDAGVDTLEHCSFLTETGPAYDPELAARIADAGTFVSPTVSGLFWKLREFMGAQRMDTLLERVTRMHEAGVRLIAGTDCGFKLKGVDNSADLFVTSLEVLEHAGLSRREVLEAATVTAAAACGLGGVTGSITAGHRADLIAVDGNPLNDLASLRRLDLVMVAGRAVTQSTVDTAAVSSAVLG
ncbi:MAG TPA: amidohydrolase family protein [Stackebrandtia sp.]|uniref:amidohydrolase family protein n=1 Tax=Stackebrandtia sp. TaxID=2023065 RepID=UPI002D51009B|nr:amidohydrolase family protein [Stackebrandtia sp.]HZE37227.1 amidohydrolase family protein [Stackebrandtia sp.]